MPLLAIRSRAIFNAAPIRQNIPPEVLSKWKEEGTDHRTIIAYMKERFEEIPPIISDPVRIQAVDLRQYDLLKEVAHAN